MSDTNITTRRVAQNRRTSRIAYAQISELPLGETAITKSSVPTSTDANPNEQYIKVGNNYYELKAKAPLASDLMFGEIAVGFPADYERLYIKNSDTDIIEFAPNVDFQLYDESGGDIGNVITSLSLQHIGNHIRLGYDVGRVPVIGEVITSTDSTPTTSEHTIRVGNAYIFQTPLSEATFDVSSLVGDEDADTRETTIYFQVTDSTVVVDLVETHTTSSDAKAAVHFGNYVLTTNGVEYQGFQPSLWYAISIKDNCIACGPQDESDLSVVQTGTGDFVTDITVNGHTITKTKGGVTITPNITSSDATTIATVTLPSGTTILKSNSYALSQNGTDLSTIGLGINGAAPSTFYTINNVAHATRAERLDLFSYTDVVYPTGLDIDATITANAIHVDDEVESAIHKLDTKLAATLTSMIDFEELMVSADESIRVSVGLEPDYSYVNKPDPNVIVGATNIREALFMLDNALGTESADTGVTAGSYGPSTDVSGYSVTIPNFTVNSKGKLTQAANKTLTVPIDSELSTTSTNAVKNSVITTALNQKQDIGTVVYDTTSNNTATVTLAHNTSYIYTNATGFTTLTVNLANVTGTPTSTDFANITYEENVYFKATSNTTTVVLTNCNATYVFGQYNPTTHTFSGFTAGQAYCLSVKDNCVVCGPVDETELSLVASSATGNHLITGLSVNDHTITYTHLDLSSTDTSRFLRHDGTWQSVTNVSVTPILTSGDDIATITVNGTSTTLKSNAYTLTSGTATNGTTFHFRKNGSSTDQNTITVYDKNVKQNVSTENADLSILLRGTSTDANASEVKYASGLKYNPSTGVLESGSFKKTNGTVSQFLMADGSVFQYRKWDIANTATNITVNSSATQNSSQPSASASTYTVAPGETIILNNAIDSLTVNLSNVTGANASTYEASVHFIAGANTNVIYVTGNSAKFNYGNYESTSTDAGMFIYLNAGTAYCLSVKDGVVICGPSAAVDGVVESHVLVVDNTGASLTVTMNGLGITPRSSNINDIKANKTNAYPLGAMPMVGDVVIIKEKITSTSGTTTKVLSTAYEYNGASGTDSNWPALSGNYSADDIIISEDIVLAGEYTRVGNITKSSTTTTGLVSAKGMTLTQLLTQIFTVELYPTLTRPTTSVTVSSIPKYVLANGSASTTATMSFTFNKGSYTYGYATQFNAQGIGTDITTNNGTGAVASTYYYTFNGTSTSSTSTSVTLSSGTSTTKKALSVSNAYTTYSVASALQPVTNLGHADTYGGHTTVKDSNTSTVVTSLSDVFRFYHPSLYGFTAKNLSEITISSITTTALFNAEFSSSSATLEANSSSTAATPANFYAMKRPTKVTHSLSGWRSFVLCIPTAYTGTSATAPTAFKDPNNLPFTIQVLSQSQTISGITYKIYGCTQVSLNPEPYVTITY